MSKDPTMTTNWIYDSPVLSDIEAKLRLLLLELANSGKLLGIQVCAYKDGEVIIDTSAGTLGLDDPRPVKPDSLFPVFSVTKGITSGMLHWLVDNGKLRLEDRVADIWPGFGSNGKDKIMVHHVLNHTSGLHDALTSLTRENPSVMLDWDACLNHIAMSTPETEPGTQQLYHYMAFGWLVGGLIEHVSGKKFQEILEEVIVHPLNISGELYIGIPPGVESRLATLTVDMDDLAKASDTSNSTDLPPSFQGQNLVHTASNLPVVFNSLPVRRSIVPAANGHCSARALARYYAALAQGGSLSLNSPPSDPPLGSHQHIPSSTDNDTNSDVGDRKKADKLFNNPNILDEFLGLGEYEHLVLRDGQFGLGFRKTYSADGQLIGFGHSGIGGSTGYCDMNNKFSIAVTVNKMSYGVATAKIILLVCSELHIPVPKDAAERAVDSEKNMEKPLIN